jgi:predicted metalloprotease with PDZ domain
VIKDLNEVASYDWGKFFQERVYDLHPEVPMNGFSQGGYKLVYTDKPVEWQESELAKHGIADFSTSLGFTVGQFGNRSDNEPKAINNVYWGSPAFKAGVTPEMEIVSVNGTAYSAKALRDAILTAEKNKQPIQLQFRKNNRYLTISFPYYDGLRYPSLERVEGTPDRLDEILAPSKSPLPSM